MVMGDDDYPAAPLTCLVVYEADFSEIYWARSNAWFGCAHGFYFFS
ncbi:hypothetical protein BQ8482_220014 [Mesorhizobium delmotii]|uniref:Uncharacterized protein n=1 Tax=Mesorhizobium delmotii TaxID=1631247 RepID=A0A2P9AL14_9HYPH|nr:hypothetical protein BQ8482_220014 [Mesorhizobium delmotii]